MAGTVDANGVLWKSTKVGSFAESFGGCTNLYDTLAASAKKQGDKQKNQGPGRCENKPP